MTRENFDEAGKLLADARGLAPTDPSVTTALKDLETLRAQSIQGRRERYAQQMIAARNAMTMKKYQEALLAFGEALKASPGDSEAVKGQTEAAALLKSQNDRKDREVRYAALLKSASEALKARRFDEASKLAGDAAKVLPDNPEAPALLRQIETGKSSAIAEIQQREKDFTTALQAAKTALAGKKYDAAVKSFSEALRLKPDSKEAQNGLQEAQTTRAELERKKRLEDYKLAMDAASAAVKKQNYQGAINSFTEALRLMPGDKTAQDGLQAAQTALKNTAVDAGKKEAFDKLITQAKQALAQQKPAEAVKHYQEALKLFPTDAAAKTGLAVASKAETNQNKQRQEDYKLAMDAASAAIKKQNYQGAINSFNEALRLMPGDRTAQNGLQAAQAALKNTGADARKKQDLDRHIAQAKQALAQKKPAEAVKHYQEALKLFPGDATATTGLEAASKAAATQNKQRQEDYKLAMDAASAAIKQQNYQGASNAFTEALRLLPGDPKAQAGLQAAQAALKNAAGEARKKEEYKRLMAQGKAALAARQYAVAAKHFADSARLMPTELEARKGLAEAQRLLAYAQFLAEGQRALQGKRFPDAVRAFTEALKRKPGDPDAMAGLQRARNGK